MSEILENIYIDRILLVAFVKYTLSQIIVFGTVFFWYLLEIVETCFLKKIFSKSSYICGIFYPKTSNFRNSGLAGRRNLLDPFMNNTFDVLSISLQYTLSFKWPNFGLNCLVTITPKIQSLKFKTSVWNFPISETGSDCQSLFKLVDNY